MLSAELSGFVQWNEHCSGNVALCVKTHLLALSCHMLTLRPHMPDSLQLGHAKVVLDNSIASGSITRNGGFVMCVCVARVPHVVKKTGIQLADAPTPPTAQTSQRGRTSSLLYPTTMSLTRSVCAFSGSSTLALPLNAMPAVPCRRPYRT